MAEVGLVAMPMTLIIVTGGIDLSVGSVFGLCAILLGVFWQNLGLPLPLAIALTLVVGGLAGAFNGWFITRVGVPPLIMTLATLALFRGLAEGISQARSVRGYPDWFFQLGQGEVMGVPTQLWLLLAVILLSAVVLATTTFGRALYAIGHNQLAARFSGIPVDRMKLLIYTFSGLMAGLAGVIFVSRVSTTRSDMGTGLELDVIAAVVLGGTSIFGGTGTILGTVLGRDPDPAAEERPRAHRGQGRRHDRRDRRGPDPLDPDHQLAAPPPGGRGLTKTAGRGWRPCAGCADHARASGSGP